MKRNTRRNRRKTGLPVILLAVILLMGIALAGAAAEGAKGNSVTGDSFTDGEGNTFRIVPLGDGRYELWKLVTVNNGEQITGGEETPTECKHEHRKWDRGNDSFHWEECLDCGKLFPPEVHEYTNVKVVQKASCTKDAVLEYSCACGRVDSSRTAPEKGAPAEYFAHHTWSDKYDSDYLSHWHTCSVCGARGEDQWHTIGNVTVDREPTCLQDGRVSYDCTVCQAHFDRSDVSGLIAERYPELKQYQALGHDFSGPLKVASGGNKVSAREDGTHAPSCIRCGRVDWEHRVSHSWAEQTISNGKCEDENDPVIIGGTCECGATLELKYTRHHQFVKDESRDVEATCTEPGKLHGERCMFCGIFGNYEFVEALGHDWVEDESKRIEPTCEKFGKKFMVCSRCGATETREIARKSGEYGHHLYIARDVQNAKCEEMGWIVKTCKFCGEDSPEGVTFEKVRHETTYTDKTRELDMRELPNGTVVRPEVHEITVTCKKCHQVWHIEKTVYRAVKGTAFKIVNGKDPGVKDLEDGFHPSGQFAKDGGVYFQNEINRELLKVINDHIEQIETGNENK